MALDRRACRATGLRWRSRRALAAVGRRCHCAPRRHPRDLGTPGAPARPSRRCGVGFVFAFRAGTSQSAAGAFRGWIALALGIWLVVGDGSARSRPGPDSRRSSPSSASSASPWRTAGAYVAAVQRRMRPADEAALYLDAAAVFFALMAARGRHRLEHDQPGRGRRHPGPRRLLHRRAGTTFLLHLATHVPLRFAGPWEIFGGLAFAAAGYMGLLLPGPGPSRRPAPRRRRGRPARRPRRRALDRRGGRSPRYVKAADALRGLLPLGSATLTVVVAMLLVSSRR